MLDSLVGTGTAACVAVGAFALGMLCSQHRTMPPESTGAKGVEKLVPAVAEAVAGHKADHSTGNKNSRKLFKGSDCAPVLCAGTLAEFQSTIQRVVRHGDHVLEIGVSGGGTSAVLRRSVGTGGRVVAIDVERKDWAAAAREVGAPLTLLDPVTDVAGLLALPLDPSVLYVDLASILGHDPALDGIALLRQLSRIFRASVRTMYAPLPRCASLVAARLPRPHCN